MNLIIFVTKLKINSRQLKPPEEQCNWGKVSFSTGTWYLETYVSYHRVNMLGYRESDTKWWQHRVTALYTEKTP